MADPKSELPKSTAQQPSSAPEAIPTQATPAAPENKPTPLSNEAPASPSAGSNKITKDNDPNVTAMTDPAAMRTREIHATPTIMVIRTPEVPMPSPTIPATPGGIAEHNFTPQEINVPPAVTPVVETPQVTASTPAPAPAKSGGLLGKIKSLLGRK